MVSELCTLILSLFQGNPKIIEEVAKRRSAGCDIVSHRALFFTDIIPSAIAKADIMHMHIASLKLMVLCLGQEGLVA